MAHRKSKGSHKKHKSKTHREKKNTDNSYPIEENTEKLGEEVYGETIMQDSSEDNVSGVHTVGSTAGASSDTGTKINPTEGINDANINNENVNANADFNGFCEDIKARQQEIYNKLNNLSEALEDITIIRNDVNSLRVDNLTELYFVRQVRPLLDALNIITFSSNNMSNTAISFQASTFSDTKEIKDALKLSYRMNDEVSDIVHSLDRRLAIFLKLIDNMDKNCPPFDYGKDS